MYNATANEAGDCCCWAPGVGISCVTQAANRQSDFNLVTSGRSDDARRGLHVASGKGRCTRPPIQFCVLVNCLSRRAHGFHVFVQVLVQEDQRREPCDCTCTTAKKCGIRWYNINTEL